MGYRQFKRLQVSIVIWLSLLWSAQAIIVADDPFNSDVVSMNATHIQQEIVFHASVHDPTNDAKGDVALVRFEPAFLGCYPLYAGAFPTNGQVPSRATLWWHIE